jgi:class 3 adenylate cyclase
VWRPPRGYDCAVTPKPELLEGAELQNVAEALDQTRWGACIYDPDWRLIWVSEELCDLLGSDDGEELGIGEPVLSVFERPPWRRTVTAQSRLQTLGDNLEYILHDFPGGKDAAAEHLQGPGEPELLERTEPRRPPPIWSYGFDYSPPEGPPVHVHTVTFPLRDSEGETFANVVVYHTGLPASLTVQLVRGDRAMFERMARLAEPGRHATAIVFADLEDSGVLSRHVPSARYFTLIRDLTNAMDRAIVSRLGILGKHAGDGASGYFLGEDLGSPGSAIEAAIQAAREMATMAATTGDDLQQDVPGAEPVRVNVGIHWAPAVYIGQVATEGRLEVTALGDQVNECARIQESASGGQLLVSKAALEQLPEERAAALELDPKHVRYVTIAELPDASEKARRDAGSIAVTSL